MGNDCDSGNSRYTLKYFIEKYGQEAMLAVSKQNIRKQQIVKKIPEISQKYQQSIYNAKILSIRQVNTVETQINNQIERRIKQIQKQDTGQVTKAQIHFDKCAEDLMGRQNIRNDCSQLRKKVFFRYEEEQKKTKQKIQRDFQSHVQKMQKQKKQKYSQIQQLKDEERACIRKQMWQRYKKQLKQFRRDVISDIQHGKMIDMVDLSSSYDHLHPANQIQEIQNEAEILIKKGEEKIKKGEEKMKKEEEMIVGKETFETSSKQILPPVGCWGC